MKIFIGRNKKMLSGSMRDLHMLTDWCKSLLCAVLPDDEIEKRFKEITVENLIDLWR